MDNHEDSATIKFRMAKAAALKRLGLSANAVVDDARAAFWAIVWDRPTGLVGPFELVYGAARPAVHVAMQPSMSEAQEALRLRYLEHGLVLTCDPTEAKSVLWRQIVREGWWLFVHADVLADERVVALDARRAMDADGTTPGAAA